MIQIGKASFFFLIRAQANINYVIVFCFVEFVRFQQCVVYIRMRDLCTVFRTLAPFRDCHVFVLYHKSFVCSSFLIDKTLM